MHFWSCENIISLSGSTISGAISCSGGELRRLVEQDGLGGVTSNPTIFEKAIDGGGQYDEALRHSVARNPSAEPSVIYDQITIEDLSKCRGRVASGIRCERRRRWVREY